MRAGIRGIGRGSEHVLGLDQALARRRVQRVELGVNVLDHLLAAFVLDVEIDVRRLGALQGNEPFEQQAHAHRIDRRDAQAVAHHRVRRRAAPLAQDPLFAAELHDFPHGQEVAAVVELADQVEFLVDLALHVVRDQARVTHQRALLHQMPQPVGQSRATGQVFRRIAVAQLRHRERTARGDLQRAHHQVRSILETLGKRVRGQQAVLGVRAQQPTRAM